MKTATVIPSAGSLKKKRVAISGKRQITIPKEFFEQLGFDKEVECYVNNGTLVLRTAEPQTNGEFAEEILRELVAKGYTGEALIREFKKLNRAVRPAVQRLLAEAKEIAAGRAEYVRHEDIFGAEESDD